MELLERLKDAQKTAMKQKKQSAPRYASSGNGSNQTARSGYASVAER